MGAMATDTAMGMEVPMAKRGPFPSSLICAAVLAAVSSAASASTEVEAEVGLGSTNNIDRAPSGRDETIASVGLRFSMVEQRRLLDLDVVGDFSWLDYLDDTFDSELVGAATGRARMQLLEDRIHWSIEDSFGQTRRDLFTPPSTNNRENINYFATGPDLRFPLGRATDILLWGRYGRVDYEFTPADTTRFSAGTSLERRVANAARVSIDVGTEQIEPDSSTTQSSYERNAAFLRYAVEGSRTTIVLDAGFNEIRGGGFDDSGAMLHLQFIRSIGSRSRWTLGLGRELTDAGSTLRPVAGQIPSLVVATGSLSQNVLPFERHYVETDWTISGRVTSLSIRGTWGDENYEQGGTLDRQRVSLGLSLTRQLSARLSGNVGATYERNEFEDPFGENNALNAEAGLTWTLGRRLRAVLSTQYYTYSSDVVPGDVHETRYWLQFRYGAPVTRIQ